MEVRNHIKNVLVIVTTRASLIQFQGTFSEEMMMFSSIHFLSRNFALLSIFQSNQVTNSIRLNLTKIGRDKFLI